MASGFENFSFAGVVLLLITLTLTVLFIYLLAINMKYIKELSYKIKIIMRAAFEKDSPLRKYKKKIESSRLNDTDPELGSKSGNEIDPRDVLNTLKKLADKGRSAKFCDILKLVMEKYNHMVMWPFTRKSEYKKYDLLRPLSRFYNLLNVTGVLIVWTLVVFIVALGYTYQISDGMVIVLAFLLTPIIGSPCIVV